jgi:hypothetical protein
VLIVDVPVTLLLGGPAKVKVLALLFGALPWARVCLFMLGQVARALELLLAVTTHVQDISGLIRLPAASHRAHDVVVVLKVLFGQGALPVSVLGASRKGNDLAVLLAYEFDRTAVFAEATTKSDLLIAGVIHLVELLS